MCPERSPSAEVFFISGVSAAKVSFPSKPYAESPTTKKLPNLSAISCRPGDTVSLNTKWEIHQFVISCGIFYIIQFKKHFY